MPLPRIICTRKLPAEVESRLARHFTVALNTDDRPFDRDRLIRAMQVADGLVCSVGDRIDAEVLDAADKRRAQIVANYAVGVNNIDLDAARAAGVVVTNTPDVLTDATADLAMALILNVTRRTWHHENRLRRGDWAGFDLTGGLGTGLQGKTLGILGMGRIGMALAVRAYYGFGMKIAYFNRSRVTESRVPGAQAMDTIEDLIEVSDVLSLHLPGGDDNRGVISASRLALMKPTACLINTARGEVVDEDALVEALQQGQIAGAGLDVFANEPHVPDALCTMDNVSLLPHIGSATHEARNAMGMLAVNNLIAHFEGGQDYPARVV